MRTGWVAYKEAAAAGDNARLAAGLDLDPQTRVPLDDLRHAQQLAAPGRGVLRQIGALSQRERVRHADQSRRAAHFSHQHGGVRFIKLTRLDQAFGGEGESAASPRVENPAEDRRRIEARRAHPRDRAVAPDQRGCRAVADQTMIFYRQIAVGV
jgi:hypothetical protein